MSNGNNEQDEYLTVELLTTGELHFETKHSLGHRGTKDIFPSKIELQNIVSGGSAPEPKNSTFMAGLNEIAGVCIFIDVRIEYDGRYMKKIIDHLSGRNSKPIIQGKRT